MRGAIESVFLRIHCNILLLLTEHGMDYGAVVFGCDGHDRVLMLLVYGNKRRLFYRDVVFFGRDFLQGSGYEKVSLLDENVNVVVVVNAAEEDRKFD